MVGHDPDFGAYGQSGFLTHDIDQPVWWEAPIDPAYLPPFAPDLQIAQTLAMRPGWGLWSNA